MSNEEILERAIQKAIDGGWEQTWLGDITKATLEPNVISGELFLTWIPLPKVTSQPIAISLALLLMSHDFAKALWGERQGGYYVEYTYNDDSWLSHLDGVSVTVAKWQYHLQQMIISDDPIKYLGENIA